MKERTELAFSKMKADMAKTYGVATVEKEFSVTPTLAQRLQDAIVENDDFLKSINIVPVDELKGQKVIGGVSGLMGKRTDTDNNDRQTSELLTLGSSDYELHFTEFDTHMRYATVDAWAKFKDFQKRYGDWVRHAIALARIKVGWYGTSAAAATDPGTNPNGEDLNIGWLELLRQYNGGAQWFTQGGTANQIQIGAGGDFANLDSAVHALLVMIDPMRRKDLVAVAGTDLIAEEKARLYEALGQTPSEKERVENEVVTKVYASLPLVTDLPFFPSRGLLVTSLKNLSIYYQEDSWRRSIVDNAKRSRVEDFNSVNEGYVIEDEEAAAGFEFGNVMLPDGAGGWQ
ncbi:phage major capsid protein, P2 family [Pseudomaricurvus alkylphenolicus]|uniref:phage major capsid protein, P2 family n=1 Tax=Pseudomaricurvus alkylphenolicus TaxID=1306991 RepID=UPI00141F6987|nr:phage major capsid protein, P2 family [Pseudomaricurvus alkylphenolicus]NIB44783.1 phage major capsid protein, P2 family [Pseudomaricurvus alkylphenolicus]